MTPFTVGIDVGTSAVKPTCAVAVYYEDGRRWYAMGNARKILKELAHHIDTQEPTAMPLHMKRPELVVVEDVFVGPNKAVSMDLGKMVGWFCGVMEMRWPGMEDRIKRVKANEWRPKMGIPTKTKDNTGRSRNRTKHEMEEHARRFAAMYFPGVTWVHANTHAAEATLIAEYAWRLSQGEFRPPQLELIGHEANPTPKPKRKKSPRRKKKGGAKPPGTDEAPVV